MGHYPHVSRNLLSPVIHVHFQPSSRQRIHRSTEPSPLGPDRGRVFLVDKSRRGAMLRASSASSKGGREESMLSETLPLVRCKKCGIGTMLPLSDYGQDGAAILYKAWVCDSPTCGYNLRIDRGQVTYGDLVQPKAQEPRSGILPSGRAAAS